MGADNQDMRVTVWSITARFPAPRATVCHRCNGTEPRRAFSDAVLAGRSHPKAHESGAVEASRDRSLEPRRALSETHPYALEGWLAEPTIRLRLPASSSAGDP